MNISDDERRMSALSVTGPYGDDVGLKPLCVPGRTSSVAFWDFVCTPGKSAHRTGNPPEVRPADPRPRYGSPISFATFSSALRKLSLASSSWAMTLSLGLGSAFARATRAAPSWS